VKTGGYIKNYQYSAPEIQLPEGRDVLTTKEGDVYGMGMVIYEASSHCPVPSRPRVNLTLTLGLNGEHAIHQEQ